MMNGSTRPDEVDRPGPSRRRIDAACDAFEAAWCLGLAPRIEDALAAADGADRTALLSELLGLERELRSKRGEQPQAAEYLARFPAHAEVVRGAFGDPGPGPGGGAGAAEPTARVARDLLLGLLALQNGFIDRGRLLAAFAAWMSDKSRHLGRILVDLGALDEIRLGLLEGLVQEHLKLHGGDPGKSLATLSSLGPAREELERAADPELRSCLEVVGSCPGELGGGGGPGAEARPTGPSRRAGSRFRVLRFHRDGGLGRVHVALDEELGREVALKEILPDKAHVDELRKRFLIEAEVTGGLEHPGVVPIYSLGWFDDGRPFYAMRFIEGDSLDEAIKAYHRASPRAEPDTVEFRKLLGRFVDLCEVIAYAHSKGVLHRDLTPRNVMLGRYGETLLIDWGLAKATGRRAPTGPGEPSEATLVPPSGDGHGQTVGVIGTPAFMSPEQASQRHEALGPATDVNGLGAILYMLLTGAPPVRGATGDELLDRVRRGEIKPPRRLNPRVPASLEAICLKALARQPADRYPSARTLADDVERWLADEPVTAWPEPWTVRTRRWLKHHRTLATASLTTGLAALVMLAAFAARLQDEKLKLKKTNLDLRAANAREKAARERERAAREDAERYLQRAFLEIGETISVLNRPDMQCFDNHPLSLMMRRVHLAQLERFAADVPTGLLGEVVRLERDFRKLHVLFAEHKAGLPPELREQLGTIRRSLEGYLRAHPADPWAEEHLSSTYELEALRLVSMDRPADARPLLLKALDMLKQHAIPGDPYGREKALGVAGIAMQLANTSPPGTAGVEAEFAPRLLRQAIAVLDRFSADGEASTPYDRFLDAAARSLVLATRAVHFKVAGRFEECRATAEAALDAAAKCPDDWQQNPAILRPRALASNCVADVVLQDKDYTRGWELTRSARDLLRMALGSGTGELAKPDHVWLLATHLGLSDAGVQLLSSSDRHDASTRIRLSTVARESLGALDDAERLELSVPDGQRDPEAAKLIQVYREVLTRYLSELGGTR